MLSNSTPFFIDWGNFGLHLSSFILIIYFLYKILYIRIYKEKTIYKIDKFIAALLFLIVSSCITYMSYQFIVSNFYYINVLENSHNNLPFFYKICALWGNHEGSMLLWLWILTLYNFIFCYLGINNIKYSIYSTTLFINHMIIFSFIIFILYTSNPFLSLFFYSTNGIELNPILQDPVLLIHPPLIYLGYLGYIITFSLTLSLIIHFVKLKKIDKHVLYKGLYYIRLFNLISWSFLTFGIFLGSWWAYYELGWGGWWFWDPVENASLIPWLFSTALVHTIIVSLKKDKLLNLTFFLAITTFLSSLIGTFFVRSGLLNSVHSFANDSSRGILLLIILSTLLVIAYAFLVRFKLNYTIDKFLYILSKEGFIYLNSLFLILFGFLIFIGTITPVLVLFYLNRDISLGHTYYNNLLKPLYIPFAILMIYGPLLKYSNHLNSKFINKKVVNFNFGLIFIALLIISFDKIIGLDYIDKEIEPGKFWSAYIHLSDISYINQINLVLISLLICNIFYTWYQQGLKKSNIYGLAHLGFAIVVIGMVISTNFYDEVNQIINYGDKLVLNNYHYLLRHLNIVEAPNYHSIYANFIVSYDAISNVNNENVISLFPEKRLYLIQNIFTTKPAIHTNLFNDLYVVIGDGNITNGWFVKIYHQPAVSFIWLGSIIIVISGFMIIYLIIKILSNKFVSYNNNYNRL